MADPTTISGSLMFLQHSDTPGGTRDKAVCITDVSYDGSRNVNSDETHCGVLKSTGPASHTFTMSAVVDTAPDADEASYNDYQTLFVNNTKKYWHLTDADETVYHGGYGWITALGQQNTTGQTAKFTLTVEIDGDLDTTATSS